MLQGIGDSSQGFANAIIFVIFTKNIRDSFIKCVCCGKRALENNTDTNREGQIQDYSCETSHLASVGEPVKSREAKLSASEEVSLVFGSIGSNINHKLEYSGQYGSIN